MLISIGIFTNATVSLSIGDFLSPILSLSRFWIAIILIMLFSVINCIGIRETTIYNHLCTFSEIIALIVLCIATFFTTSDSKITTSNVKIPDILYASILAMFVYSGFESTVKLSEEAKDPNDIPKAIVSSVITAIGVYVLVSIAVIKCCKTDKIDQYPIPIVKMASILFGSKLSYLFYMIAILSISNTLLISILGTSRMLYSVSREHTFLDIFTQVDENTQTPIFATIAISILSIIMLLFKDVETLASITTYLMFIVFILLNTGLITVYQDETVQDKLKDGWTYKFNQGKPILPTIGLVLSIGMLIISVFYDNNQI